MVPSAWSLKGRQSPVGDSAGVFEKHMYMKMSLRVSTPPEITRSLLPSCSSLIAIDIALSADQLTHDLIDELKTILANATRGNCTPVIRLKISTRSETVVPLPEAWAVSPTDDLMARLERLFGDRVATLA